MASEDPFVNGSDKPDPTSTMSNPGLGNASDQDSDSKTEKFALGRRGQLVFFTLAVLTLMAALDGTSLSVALPVSLLGLFHVHHGIETKPYQDNCQSLEWHSY